jgi:type IV pilus biogenesis protein CpaD/CtpE
MTIRKIGLLVLLAGVCVSLISGCGQKKKDTTPAQTEATKTK